MKANRILTAGIMAILLIGLASAFGVGAPYWEDNPLVMERGTTKNVEINLQNMVGNDDVSVKAELKGGFSRLLP